MTWLDDLVTFAASGLGDRERSALLCRGVSEAQIELYRWGYLNRELPPLTGADHFVKWAKGGAKLDDVFVMPLTNALGDIRGVQFRHVERDRTGYMDYFVDQSEPVFFGLSQAMPAAWQSESLFLVEGNFDLCAVQRTFPEAVATLTARVTEPLIRFMRRFVRHVWLGYDMDATGRRAGAKFARECAKDFDIKVVSYPVIPMTNGKNTKDPSDLWEMWGEERLSAFLRALKSDNGTEIIHAQGIRYC